jgi:hypothetical protein
MGKGAGRLVWLLLALWTALTAAGTAFSAEHGETLDVLIGPALAVFAAVGALLATRRPRSPTGWLLLVVAVLIAFSGVAQGVSAQGESPPGGLELAVVWLDTWAEYVWLGLIGMLVPQLFPDGALPSRPRRALFGVSVVAIGAAAVGTAFGTRRLEWGADQTVANPLRLPGAAGDVLEALATTTGPAFALVIVAVLAGLAVRLRRATGVERLQLKWVALAMAIVIVGLFAAALGETTERLAPVGNVGWWLFLTAMILGLPLAIGIAVMRYRLYDIDFVINRALVYGALTATLGAAYLALALLLGLTVGRSDLTVALSTLAVAALFGPARRRIQAAVDRRFYRRRYDAAHTLEAFGGRLRDEIDLEALGADLSAVVRETVQPAHVSLWLRSPQ